MTKVHKCNVACLIFAELSSSEESIVECDSSVFVDESQAVDVGDSCSVEDTLSLDIREIWWHRQHNVWAISSICEVTFCHM